MRLLVDLQACQGPSASRGIGYYARSLVRALAASRGQNELVVLLDGGHSAEAILELRHSLAPLLGRDEVVLFPAPDFSVRPRAMAETEAAREAAIAALQPDVVLVSSLFELAPYAPMTLGQWCSDVPTAAVLYDLIPLADLDLHKADRALRAEYLRAVEQLGRADLLLSISDFSAAEARRLLPDCPPCVTVHGAAPTPPLPRQPRVVLQSGFALSVGLDEPRKDIPTAVLAWASLPPALRRGKPFVVAGGWPEEGRSRLRAQAIGAGLPEQELVFAGAVDDAELAWLYAHADLFVFPSLTEGLGLPPLEAATAGTPSLLAASSSLVELFDDEAAYFPPSDVAALASRMTEVLSEPELRARLLDTAIRAVKHFTWERTADRTWRALQGLPRRAVAGPAVPGTLHRLTRDWAEFEAELVRDPGVVVLPALAGEHEDLSALLAPVMGAITVSAEDAARALELGVTAAPVAVGVDEDSVTSIAQHCWNTDVGILWASALTPTALDPDVVAAMSRRPRWSNRPRGRLLASDVTIYRSTAFLSGIQRATRRLHAAVAAELRPRGGAVVPVSFAEMPTGTPHPIVAADPVLSAVEARPDEVDWVLGLDLDDRLAYATADLQQARADGVGVAVNVYDLLPWAHPEWWPSGAARASFVPWARAVTLFADVLLVNSVATATELERFVASDELRRPDSFEVQLLRLGADLEHVVTPSANGRERDHFVMVGTIEPRKGHAEVLSVLEELWRRGSTARLTVIGRAGWMVEQVTARMDELSAYETRFRWLKNAPDAELDALYGTCTAVVVASEGEGFGLPVVEAAIRDCPVVVRDIPVLRELAGDAATYFGTDAPLLEVLNRVLREGASVPSLEHVQTWGAVGRRLLDILDGSIAPLARWSPADGWSWS